MQKCFSRSMKGGQPFAASAAQRLLAFEADGDLGRDAAALARRIHDKLDRHLSPVIGDIGFAALFARAAKLTRAECPVLARMDAAAPGSPLLEQLCACLNEEPAGRAVVATLLFTVLNLLSTFIGEGLTWRLLRNAWPELFSAELPPGENP